MSRPILVTGAGSGIGRAIALTLAAQGHPVGVSDLNLDAATDTATVAESDGGRAIPVHLDVTSSASVTTALKELVQQLGTIGGVVNNAGWSQTRRLEEQDDEYLDRVISINLGGTLKVSRAVVPLLREHGSGRVVNIASDSARIGLSRAAGYTAAKGGVLALTRSLARELAKDSITVNSVSPGIINTPLFQADVGSSGSADKIVQSIPMRRIGEPEDVAASVAFFCSEQAAYVTGQVLSVSGGMVIS